MGRKAKPKYTQPDEEGNLIDYTGPTPDPTDLITITPDQITAVDDWFPHIIDPRKRAFLDIYSDTCNVKEATILTGIGKYVPYQWMKNDPDFRDAFADIKAIVGDSLEAEAYRRAKVGWDEPVYQGGGQVGTIRKYSDTMLIFLLKAAKPEKYRERYDVTTNSSLSINMGIQGELAPGV